MTARDGALLLANLIVWVLIGAVAWVFLHPVVLPAFSHDGYPYCWNEEVSGPFPTDPIDTVPCE